METKKLYRIPANGMLGGLCVGLGEYLNLDVTIVRLIFILLFLTGSAGFWIYLIMWIIVPVKPLGA
jgi:phage shock protein C